MNARPVERRLVARTRGQVMVLGCVALLVTALMLMVSFSLTNAIHEKIRIQSHSDAAAYSMATIEARAFNATAHHNRAIAAALVAQMSLHSWMAIASNDVAMLFAGQKIMQTISGMETAMGCSAHNTAHCECVSMANVSGTQLFMKGMDYADKLQSLDSTFNDAVADLTEMINDLHEREVAILSAAEGEIADVGEVLSSLQYTNANRSEYVTALFGDNLQQFRCAQEGGTDEGEDCNGRSAASQSDRSRIIQNTANASRPQLDLVGTTQINHDNFKEQPDEPQDALMDGEFMHQFVTQARTGEGFQSDPDNGHTAENVGAGNRGQGMATVSNFRHSPPVSQPFEGKVYSDESGGRHTPLWGHGPDHDGFQGVQLEDPCSTSCFVNFRASSDPASDFGWPTVYAGVVQDSRLYQTKYGDFRNDAAWEINDTGEVNIELVEGRPARLQIVPRDYGIAVSKAKVYFHQQGNWQVPPNFFDPFWRSKLHFFHPAELQYVLNASGDAVGVDFLNQGGPAEGEE